MQLVGNVACHLDPRQPHVSHWRIRIVPETEDSGVLWCQLDNGIGCEVKQHREEDLRYI